MDPFLKHLKHLVEITCHRDHTRLDVAVVSALYKLVDAEQVRALDIFQFRDQWYVQQRVWVSAGEAVALDNLSADHPMEPISAYPSLASCIEQHQECARELRPDHTHVLWLPVWLNEKVGACIEIRKSSHYTKYMLGVIRGIFDVYHNYLSLLDYSERDSLTGLFNRKTFDEKFAKLAFPIAPNETQSVEDDAERRQRAGVKAQWLAVVDIDHFKRVNDQFGHLYGDEVLILIANILRSSFRSHDRVFRFGGEEFVILLRSTTPDIARTIFERFRRTVERHEFPQVGAVTVSLGFARISGEAPVAILGHADQALYFAKEHGRNRICSYDELISTGALHSEVANEGVEFF